MSALLIALVAGCSGGEARPEGAALPGTLTLNDGTEVELEGQLFTDGSITVSGSDGATSLELTVLEASSEAFWTQEESTGLIPVVLLFSTGTGTYSEADVPHLSWTPLDNGKYAGGFYAPSGDWNVVQVGPTTPVDYHCIFGEDAGGLAQGLYCEEQTYEQFDDERPEGGCWQPGLCPMDRILGICEADGGDGTYWLEGMCVNGLIGEPLPDGTTPISNPEELCTYDGGTWTEMGEGTCE